MSSPPRQLTLLAALPEFTRPERHHPSHPHRRGPRRDDVRPRRGSSLQRSLFAAGEPVVDPAAVFERRYLDDDSWVDVARRFLRGADTLFDQLRDAVPWTQDRRWMYERMVDVPRLSHWYGDDRLPHAMLVEIQRTLEARYGVPFRGVGLNYYRDGDDSVASHQDRELRELDGALVALVTLGARRPFLLRPIAGGRSVDFAPASGDLLVMGGPCQARFAHGVPKVTYAGPRISISYRWSRAVAVS